MKSNDLHLYSVIIPARNEEDCIESTVRAISAELKKQLIPHEIVVVDDGSSDKTWDILQKVMSDIPELAPVQNKGKHGYGRAIIFGFDHMKGDAAVVTMADASEDPSDICKFWDVLQEGYDCAFGSRFIRGGKTHDYPRRKLIMNRLINFKIQILFQTRFNDVTNGFKAYRKTVIDGCRPFLSHHFNLAVELPLKAMIRGYTWKVVPNTWRNRTAGEAKLKLVEMGSRYMFIIYYCLLEKWLSRGDYHRKHSEA